MTKLQFKKCQKTFGWSGSQSGQIIFVSLIVLTVLMTLSGAVFSYAIQHVKNERIAIGREQALMLAESGIDKAIYELNQNPSYSGDIGVSLGNGEFSTSVASISANEKRITSTGYVPNSTNPIAVKTVKATVNIETATASFQFGVQVGQGGLTMSNGSQINGNIFSNGSISGSGTITGSATVAAGSAASSNQEWTATNADFTFGDIASRKDAAQSFAPSLTDNLIKVSVSLKKTGLPNDIVLKIVTDNNNKPSKTVLASGTMSAALVSSSYGFIDATLSATPNLTSGTKYWLILSTANVSGSNYYSWALDTSGSYVYGTGKYSANWNASDPAWNDAGGDFDFKIYLGEVITTLSGVTVNGDARATNMSSCAVGGDAYFAGTSTTCSVTGIKHPGTAAPAPQTMPISDAQISDWENAAQSGGTIASVTISNNAQRTLGPVKIDGNLTMSNGSKLYLTGPVWVNGNISVSNSCIIQVDSSLGNASTIIIADTPVNPSSGGQMNISNNSILQGNGFPDSYLLAISTYRGDGAINVSNNMGSVILYASNGSIDLANNAGANQLTGYAVNLSNNSTVDYLSGLQDITFSQGPGGSWEYKTGSYAIIE